MNRRKYFTKFIVTFLSFLCAQAALAEDWDYSDREGPEHWSELDGHNLPCSAGSQQSPVDISNAIEAELPALQVRWRKTEGTIVNNGHTIQIDLAEGSTLRRGKEHFKLLQLHFHAPSEHHVDGKVFPMEAHFVHEDVKTGILGVLSVFLVPGKTNKAFADLAAAFPGQRGEKVSLEDFHPMDLLPESLEYWLYEGSLTTPPCSEDVEWMVAVAPLEVGAADMEKFTALYPRNARPIHAHNRRFILRED